MNRGFCVMLAALAAACAQGERPQKAEKVRSRQEALAVVPSFETASLVALSSNDPALRIASSANVSADRMLANGPVFIDTGTVVLGNLETTSNLTLQPNARLKGSATAGGTIKTEPGAVIEGTRSQNASVARRIFPSTNALLSGLAADFGVDAPSIRLNSGTTQTLPAGGRRVDQLDLQQNSTLVVDRPAALELKQGGVIGPNAAIIVRNGASLILKVSGNLNLQASSRIVQEGQAFGRGLIVALTPGSAINWGTNASFGPGLVYGSGAGANETARVQEIARFNGAIVAGQINLGPGAAVTLDSKYLTCATGVPVPATIQLIVPASGAQRSVPPGTTQVPLVAQVSGKAVDQVTLLDAASERVVTPDAQGIVRDTARLLPNGEATNVCVAVRDCRGEVQRACSLVTVRHSFDVQISSPSAGSIASGSTVVVTGRVSGATPRRVSANGVAGAFTGNTFVTGRVPLGSGTTLIDVEVESTSGEIVRQRLAVGRASLSVRDVYFEIDSQRRITVLKRSAPFATSVAPPRSGQMQYRLVDSAGRQLHRGGIPGTGPSALEIFEPGGVTHGYESSSTARAVVRIPVLASSASLELYDALGHLLGAVAP